MEWWIVILGGAGATVLAAILLGVPQMLYHWCLRRKEKRQAAMTIEKADLCRQIIGIIAQAEAKPTMRSVEELEIRFRNEVVAVMPELNVGKMLPIFNPPAPPSGPFEKP